LLGLAVLLHLANLLLRATAWRAILRAAVPGHRVPWRGVTGAYLAGAGMNGVLPARGGDVAKVVLVNRSVPGASCAVGASALLVVLRAGGATPAAVLSFRVGTQLVMTTVNVLVGGISIGLPLGTMPWRVRLSVPIEPEPVPIPLPVATSGE